MGQGYHDWWNDGWVDSDVEKQLKLYKKALVKVNAAISKADEALSQYASGMGPQLLQAQGDSDTSRGQFVMEYEEKASVTRARFTKLFDPQVGYFHQKSWVLKTIKVILENRISTLEWACQQEDKEKYDMNLSRLGF